MPTINFYHPNVGTLTIQNGIDEADWAYGLNTQTYPTYGGEVVQILSVYIDNLTLTGTVSTYRQIEAIYKYFAQYFILATQGATPTPTPGESYNLQPMIFTYTDRNWQFKIYPQSAPGFGYRTGAVGPQWQLSAFIIDDSPDLSVIKSGIKAAAVTSVNSGLGEDLLTTQSGTFSLTGNISPTYDNPQTDPFQTSDSTAAAAQAEASQYVDFYSALLPAYMKGDFSSLVGVSASLPNYGSKTASQTSVTVPAT